MPEAQPAGAAIAAPPFQLTAEQAAAGFVRPLRTQVQHARCETTSAMKPEQAEQMARDPASWSTCWCNVCGRRQPSTEFTWFPDGSPVGS